MWKNRLGYFLIISAMASLIIPINGLSTVSGHHVSYDHEGDLEWKIVFVTSRDECSQRNVDALMFYAIATDDLLRLHKVPNVLVGDLVCVGKDKRSAVIENTVATSDLAIIITDYFLSIAQRHTSGSLGHYAYAYDVKSIVVQAETLSIESKNTAWILSHEIAHFALDYYGYPNDVWAGGVHKIQKQYNDCKSSDVTLALCVPIWTTIKTLSGKYFSVMKPLYTERYVIPTQQKTSEPIQQSTDPRKEYAYTQQLVKWTVFNNYKDDLDMLVLTYPLTTVPFESADARADYKRAIEKRNDIKEKLTSALNDLRLADSYFLSGSYERAVSLYGDASLKTLNMKSDVSKIYSMINSALLVEKEFQREKEKVGLEKTPQPEAQKTFSRSEIDEIVRLDKLGIEKLNLGLYNEAIIYFDEALLINPDKSGLLNNKGVALEKLKKYPEALEYFQKAVAIQPYYEPYLKNKEIVLKIIQKQELSSEPTITHHDTFLTLEARVGSDERVIEFNPILKYSSGKEIVTNNVKVKVKDTEYQVNANKWSYVRVSTAGEYKLTASFDGYSTQGGTVVYGDSSDIVIINTEKPDEPEKQEFCFLWWCW